uniref:Uncharacterized protein n=1 Tax=Anguilla anguilla TaxID=7936 RepID=A0A0E9T843_ANGAN
MTFHRLGELQLMPQRKSNSKVN